MTMCSAFVVIRFCEPEIFLFEADSKQTSEGEKEKFRFFGEKSSGVLSSF